MNMQKLTQKSMEAVQSARSMAEKYGNQQLEQEQKLDLFHILNKYSLRLIFLFVYYVFLMY